MREEKNLLALRLLAWAVLLIAVTQLWQTCSYNRWRQDQHEFDMSWRKNDLCMHELDLQWKETHMERCHGQDAEKNEVAERQESACDGIEAIERDGEEPERRTYRCYECGNTNGFTPHRDWESGIIDAVECNECDCENTDFDGEGSPWHREATGSSKCDLGWTCSVHKVFKCEECWEWKPWPNDREPLDIICSDCEEKDG